MTGLVLRLWLVIFGFVAFMYRNLLFALSLFFFSHHHYSSIKICIIPSYSVYSETVQWLIYMVLAAIPDSPHGSSCCLKFLGESDPLIKRLFFDQSYES